MKKTLSISLMLLFLLTRHSFSQKSPSLALKPGESVPNLKVEMLQYKSKQLNLASLKGKWVILDFWNAFCTTCIAAFPKMQALQAQFEKNLVILPVGFEGNPGDIENLVKHKKGTRFELHIPYAVQRKNDLRLYHLFPLQGYPTEIWIDPEGHYRGTTDHEAVTAETIQSLINGGPFDLPDIGADDQFDPSLPLYVNGNGGPDSAFLFRTLITAYNPRALVGARTTINSRFTRVAETMTGPLLLKEIYQSANPGDDRVINAILEKNLIIESNNPLLTAKIPTREDFKYVDSFNKKNLFTAEIICPPDFTRQDALRAMLRNVEDFFGADIVISKRNVSCLALQRISTEDKIGYKGVDSGFTMSEDSKEWRVFGENTRDLVGGLNNATDIEKLVLDETHYSGKISIKLNLKTKNLDSFRQALRVYDLDLVEVKRELDVFVISDRAAVKGVDSD